MQVSNYCESQVGGYVWGEGRGSDWDRAPGGAPGVWVKFYFLTWVAVTRGSHWNDSLSYTFVLYDFSYLFYLTVKRSGKKETMGEEEAEATIQDHPYEELNFKGEGNGMVMRQGCRIKGNLHFCLPFK